LAKGDEEEYEVTRKNITGGLSNVHNKKNLRYYKNLVYEKDKVNIIDTNNIITHIIGIDFNYLLTVQNIILLILIRWNNVYAWTSQKSY
jgi:hypothetical protein